MSFLFSKPVTFKVVPLLLALLCTACSAKAPTDTVEPLTESTEESASQVAGDPVYFGVLAIDSAVSVTERYRPLMEYLSTEVQRPVELVILSQESQFDKVEEGALDFIANNPLAAVQVQRLFDTEFFVTHTRPKTGAKFSGLIVVDSDSEIKGIEDLEGKRAACVNFQTAAAGCIFQIYHLLENGFDPYEDFSKFIENKSQDNIVLAVLNGTVDAGFIRTGQLEKMVNKGLLSSIDEVRIIDPAEDEFFYSHTTALYPEWPVAATANTEPELVSQVQTALLKLSADHPALEKLKADGFIPAVDYSSLDNLIETLELKSWDAEGIAQ